MPYIPLAQSMLLALGTLEGDAKMGTVNPGHQGIPTQHTNRQAESPILNLSDIVHPGLFHESSDESLALAPVRD